MLVPFQGRLYFQRGIHYRKSKSWDLKTGQVSNHENLKEQDDVIEFAIAEVNDKIWRTGGISQGEAIKTTFFLLPNFTWIKGPELPEKKESHTMVRISDREVLLLGGNLKGFARESANGVWLYNDEYESFDIRKDFELGAHPSAAMTYIKDMAKEVILILVKGRAYFYDVSYDAWIQADNTWIHPVQNFELIKLFVSSDKRSIIIVCHFH